MAAARRIERIARQRFLTWRPFHLPTTQHVQVQVINRLCTVTAVIYHQTKTIIQTLLFRNFLRDVHQMSQQSWIRFLGFRQLLYRLTWNDQKMLRCLWIHVVERHALKNHFFYPLKIHFFKSAVNSQVPWAFVGLELGFYEKKISLGCWYSRREIPRKILTQRFGRKKNKIKARGFWNPRHWIAICTFRLCHHQIIESLNNFEFDAIFNTFIIRHVSERFWGE